MSSLEASHQKFFADLLKSFTTPGSGVFTVHTAQEKKLAVLKSLYGNTTADFDQEWQKSLQRYASDDRVTVIGIPSDSGGGIQRGANWGPVALREQMYHQPWGKHFFDLGDVRVNPHLLQDELLNQTTLAQIRKSMHGDDKSHLPVSPLSIAEYILALHHEAFPKKKIIMLGGDHSVSYPMVKEFLIAKKKQGIRAAVIHFDAHTDLLAERLGVPVCFGSWVPHAMKELDSPDLWVQIGIRSSGKNKAFWESSNGLQQYWADEIQQQGYDVVAELIATHLQSKQVEEIYITFDIDALDGNEASATGTPERNGLKAIGCVEMIDLLSSHFKLTGADLVEVAPFVHHAEFNQEEPKTTLRNALKILHAFERAMNPQ